MDDVKAVGDTSDRLVELPLRDEAAQQCRLAVEQRLREEWQMPPFWSRIGVDYTTARDEVEGEEDSYAFTDALVFGYVLREVDALRPGARSVPDDVAARLAQAPAEARQRVALETTADLAQRVPEILSLTGEAWDEFEYWARQFNLKRSRGRRRERQEAVGIDYLAPLPSLVDYEGGLAFGYALRCCAEVSDWNELEPAALSSGALGRGDRAIDRADDTGAGASAEPEFDPLDPPDGDARAAAEDLLMRTEAIFVDIRAPSRLGAVINAAVLTGMSVGEEHPSYGANLGVALFGYSARMAQAERAPVSTATARDLDGWLLRVDSGGIDYDRMADDPGALSGLLEEAMALADDERRIFALLRVPLEVWAEFAELAVGQLQLNLRRNRLKRRHMPPPEQMEALLRLGCAIRVIDEVAGEAPFPASAL